MLEQRVERAPVLPVVSLHVHESGPERFDVALGEAARVGHPTRPYVDRPGVPGRHLDQGSLVVRERSARVGHNQPVGQPGGRALDDHLISIIEERLLRRLQCAAGDHVGRGRPAEQPRQAVGVAGLEVF